MSLKTSNIRWFGVVAIAWLFATGFASVAASANPEPTPRTALALEQAHAFLDWAERELDADQGVDDSKSLATDERTSMLRKLHFVRRELTKLGDGAAVVVSRLEALAARASGPSVKMDGTGVIEGRVTVASTGLPVVNVLVELFDIHGGFRNQAETDSSGTYRFTSVPVGGYRLAVVPGAPYLSEVYDDLPCFGGCNINDGTLVDVAADQTVDGVDFVLQAAGSITGTVRDAASLIPIPFLELRRDGTSGGFPYEMTDLDGEYTFAGLGAGTATVRTNSNGRYLDQVFNGVPCYDFPGLGCTPSIDGTPIAVMLDEASTGIDFDLDRGAVIEGHVRGLDTGVPVPEWSVVVYNEQGSSVHSGESDAAGRYEIAGLPPGTYFAVTSDRSSATRPPFVNVLYDGQLCPVPPGSYGCDPRAGTPIVLSHNESRTIDFLLPRRGTVSGRIVDAASDQPLGGIEVSLFNEVGYEFRQEVSAADGRYRFEHVVPITHRARVDASGTDYLDEVYQDIACNPSCDGNLGRPIEVAVNTETAGIDFTLELGGVIEGRVFDAISGEPLRLDVDLSGRSTGSQFQIPDAQGGFRFRRLQTDSYRVLVAFSTGGYLKEVWNNVHCPIEGCADLGTTISIVPGQTVTGIEMALDLGGEIRGEVIDSATGDRPYPIDVLVWDESGAQVDGAYFTAGLYAIDALLPGRYRVATNSSGAYRDQAWPDVPCPVQGCDGTQGELIEVEFGDVIDSVDFALDPIGCQTTATAMCVNDERFRVEIDWRTPQGNTGKARPQQLTNDSGYLWFFNRDNVEAVVKVLDACSSPSNRFWVFAAGLTNVEATLRITDTWTNTERIYTNSLGVPFAPIQDTQAFATCEAPPPKGFVLSGKTSGFETTTAKVPEAKGGCPFGGDVLCLAGSRFAIRARWTSPTGASGVGEAVFLTDDTGYFWFFNPDNVEVIVKVLDACTSPAQRFWVFAGGLTNVEVEIEVLDTVTDEIKIYTNPLGVPFAPIQDTQAFDTCP